MRFSGRTFIILTFLIVSFGLEIDARNLTFHKCILNTYENTTLQVDENSFSTANTSYVITAKCDAGGRIIRIPRNCNLIFQGEGCIANARIVFNDTWLESPCFKNILSYSGTLGNKTLNLTDFGTVDDTNLLYFIFSQLQNSSKIIFESRKYKIDALRFHKGRIDDNCFIEIKGKKNLTIDGNGAQIIDSASDVVLYGALFSVFKFDGCSSVVLKNLSYTWTHEPMLHPEVRGMIFIRTINQNMSFDIDVEVNSCGRGLYSGKWNNINGHPGRGLCDSKIIVHANKVGYPIAIEKGDNLNIQDYFDIAHRGLYLAGVTNAHILVEGKDAYSTQVNLLLTDTMDADGWYFCDNIDATVIDKGTAILSDRVFMAFCQIYPLKYKQFVGRPPYKAHNICFHLFTPGGTETSYELLNIKDQANVGDQINVSVDGIFNHNGKNDRLFRIYKQPRGTVVFNNIICKNNTIAYSGELPDDCRLIFNHCPNIYFEWKPQKSPSTGVIKFHDCSFKNSLVRLKDNKNYNYVNIIKD